MPLFEQQVVLLAHGHTQAGAAYTALASGDTATAARMMAEAIEAFTQARKLEEKARQQ